jgi:large subunit ribosomal protein L29
MTKPSELRKLPVSELQKRIQDTKKELMELRFQSSIGQLDKNHRVAEAKREIARMMTVLGEKAKGITVVSEAEAPAAKKPRAKKVQERSR